MTDHARYDVSAKVATLTLDSPPNRNALSSGLVAELRKGLADAAGGPDVRAVVLPHTGGTFCAGADLSEASAAGADADPDVLAGTGATLNLPWCGFSRDTAPACPITIRMSGVFESPLRQQPAGQLPA